MSDEFQSRNFLKNNKTRLLVIHGDKDFVVPFKFGAEIFSMAEQENKVFWTIKDGVHTDVFVRHEGVYQKKFLAFIESL